MKPELVFGMLFLYSVFMMDRNENLRRLREISEALPADASSLENMESLKNAAALSAECCRSSVSSSTVSGREIIEPVIISDEDREFCVSVYDRCTEMIKAVNRYYIPDPIERTAPGRERLLFLIREFLADRARASSAAQQTGTGFNRLFGSRG